MRYFPPVFMSLAVLPFVLGILAADAQVLGGLSKQLATLFYSSAPGTITHSEVKAQEGSHVFQARYTFEVDGLKFEGSWQRDSERGSSEASAFDELKSRFPVGASVPVFYRSGTPADSVLRRGIGADGLFFLLFMTMLHLMVLGFVLAVVREWKDALWKVRATKRAGRAHVTLSDTHPLLFGILASSLTAFACFIVLSLLRNSRVWWALILLAWVLVVGVGMFVARRVGARTKAGHDDLILDPRAQSISLPELGDRGKRLDVPWSQIQAISVESRVIRTRKGRSRTQFRPVLELMSTRGPGPREAVSPWGDQHRAEQLAAWLRPRVECGALTAPPVKPPAPAPQREAPRKKKG
jgi:hypothetical protein